MTKTIQVFSFSQCFCSMCDQGCFDYGTTYHVLVKLLPLHTHFLHTKNKHNLWSRCLGPCTQCHHIQNFDAMSLCSLSYVNTLFNITGHWWTTPTLHFEVDRNTWSDGLPTGIWPWSHDEALSFHPLKMPSWPLFSNDDSKNISLTNKHANLVSSKNPIPQLGWTYDDEKMYGDDMNDNDDDIEKSPNTPQMESVAQLQWDY